MTPSPTDPRQNLSQKPSRELSHELSTEEKRALLRKLLRSKMDPTSEPFPLTLEQRALWFLQSLVPDSFAYNVPISLRFTPPLDLTSLQSALDTSVARHPALRIQFQEHAGVPRQQAMPPATAPIDVREMPDADAILRQEVLAESRRPFSLDGPLFRAALWRGATADLFLLTIHHLVCDGHSGLLLLHDLGTLYRAARQGVPHQLAPLTATYRDFVTAQQQLLVSDDDGRLWSYWAQQLSGSWENLELPAVRPRPSRMTLRGGSIAFEITPEHAVQLKQLAQRQRTTFYAVVYTAMQTVLYQFTGQTDLVIGTPSSVRTRPEWNSIVGYFINMLPIHVPMTGERSFADQLRLVHGQLMGALAHQEFPFPAMVERLKVARDTTRTPIFQTIVNVSPANQRTFSSGAASSETLFGDSRFEPYLIPSLEGQFDLAVEIVETERGLIGVWKYSTDAFDKETAKRMLDAFQRMLNLAIENAELSLREMVARTSVGAGQLPLRTDEDAEREELTF
jgi:hypothetical protein